MMVMRHIKKWLKSLRRKEKNKQQRIPKGLNPRKETARRMHVENVKRQQSQGMEHSYMRKAIRAAKYGDAHDKRALQELQKAGGFK